METESTTHARGTGAEAGQTVSPQRILSACTIPGCPRRSVGRGLCAEHEMRRRAAYDATRPNSQERGYDAEWARLRKQVLAEEPTCRICGEPSTDAHHIVPIAQGGDRLDRETIAALCHTCHSRLTATQHGGYGNARRVERR
jgi:5-methylcytosine-specific restriction protein A